MVLGRRLLDLEQRGDRVQLRFQEGERIGVDLVIGADGINSQVRALLFDREEPRFTGRIAQRVIFPTDRVAGSPMPDCTKWWGVDRHILAYYLTEARNEIYLMGSVPAETWEGDGSWYPCSRDDLIASFQGFHPDLLRVVEACEEATVMPIFDRPRDDRWSVGRVVLLGDVCHPVRPYMAAGGSMAIEDAVILSRCLNGSDDDPVEAIQRYQGIRIPRVAEVQRISIENSWMHGPTETDWFFDYDAAIAPHGIK